MSIPHEAFSYINVIVRLILREELKNCVKYQVKHGLGILFFGKSLRACLKSLKSAAKA